MTDSARFPIRFTGANKAMAVLGITRRSSWVEVSPTEVSVHMSWGFDGRVPRSSVRSVTEDRDRVLGWGAHGWNGVWLVNGSSSGIVRIELDPPGTARVVVFPVKLRVLRVAVEDPEGLVRALGAA